MGFEASYDYEHDVVMLKVKGPFTADDACAFSSQARAFLEGRAKRYIIVDLAEAGALAGTEARKVMAENLRTMEVTHLAMINARPAVRIMGKILVKLTGGPVESGFFASRDEALSWLEKVRAAA